MADYSKAHICQCLRRISTVCRNSPVTISGDRRKTGAQFVEGVLNLARGLLQMGLQRGDVVAISALNSDLYLEWLLAVSYAGGVTAPLNYRWVSRPTMIYGLC
ncbi:unnamed protein product [Cuscuta campestris]|uniref:AMP-dependent synthetase/ligase domain-containing protein n=1 Tax=Cuscuta campestris TaxID=132261 RepID=A0A484M4J7_9ASTE|nr:unnamed protein product [Cuscuta campestris]